MGFGGEIVGISLHNLDWESRGGAHRVAHEAVSELKSSGGG
jgi:hypothetical protein